jgi:hypothetical protein
LGRGEVLFRRERSRTKNKDPAKSIDAVELRLDIIGNSISLDHTPHGGHSKEEQTMTTTTTTGKREREKGGVVVEEEVEWERDGMEEERFDGGGRWLGEEGRVGRQGGA